MNKIKIAALVALAAVFSFAQEDEGLKLGLRAGYNFHIFADNNGNQVGGPDNEPFSIGWLGFGLGLTVNIPLTSFLDINPELGLGYRKFPVINVNDFEAGITEFVLNIPVLFQIHPFGDHHYITAGVQLDIPFSSEVYIKEDGQEETEKYDDRAGLDFGIVIGYGYLLNSNIKLDVRIARYFTKLGDKDIDDGHLEQGSIGLIYFF